MKEIIDCYYLIEHQEGKVCGMCEDTNKLRYIPSLGLYAPSSLSVSEAEKQYQASVDALANRYRVTN